MVRDSLLEAIGTTPSAEQEQQSASAGSSHGQQGEATVDTGKTTQGTMKAAEYLIEALELSFEERLKDQRFQEATAAFWAKRTPDDTSDAPPARDAPSLMLLGRSPSDYVLRTLLGIKSAQLDEALLALPFSCVTELLHWLSVWLAPQPRVEAGTAQDPSFRHTDLASRVLFLLLRTHSTALIHNDSLADTLMSLKRHARENLKRERDTIGYNMAALRYIRSHLERTGATSGGGFFGDAIVDSREKKKQKRKKSLLG